MPQPIPLLILSNNVTPIRALRALQLAWTLCFMPLAAPCATPGWPDTTELRYDGRGLEGSFFRYSGTGVLRWQHTDTRYQASLEISALGLHIRTLSSTGLLDTHMLLPERFDDTPRGAAWSTRFLRDQGQITFSSGSAPEPLQSGAQDKLSALLQLGAVLAADPARGSIGNTVHFQAADAHRADNWVFRVDGNETLELGQGRVTAIKLTREPTPENGQKIEAWLASEVGYLPVRLRITESDGSFIDLLWRKTQKSG